MKRRSFLSMTSPTDAWFLPLDLHDWIADIVLGSVHDPDCRRCQQAADARKYSPYTSCPASLAGQPAADAGAEGATASVPPRKA